MIQMLDMLGQVVNTGNIIAYSQRGGDRHRLTVGIVLDVGAKKIIGLNAYLYEEGGIIASVWIPKTKPGKLDNYERAIKLKPSMINDFDLFDTISELREQYNLED